MMPNLSEEQIQTLINFGDIEFEGIYICASEKSQFANHYVIDIEDLDLQYVHKDHWNVPTMLNAVREGLATEYEKYAEEPDFDPEYEERRRVVDHVSSVCGGLTSSEVNDIMYDY